MIRNVIQRQRCCQWQREYAVRAFHDSVFPNRELLSRAVDVQLNIVSLKLNELHLITFLARIALTDPKPFFFLSRILFTTAFPRIRVVNTALGVLAHIYCMHTVFRQGNHSILKSVIRELTGLITVLDHQDKWICFHN